VYYAALLGITTVITQPPKMRPVLARFARKYLRAGTILFIVLLLAIIGAVACTSARMEAACDLGRQGAFIQTPSASR